MNKNNLKTLFTLCWFPAVLTILGLFLLLNPDSAIALITKVIAWILIAAGAIGAIDILSDKAWANLFRWVQPLVCLGIGVYFLNHPLILAEMLGWVVGLLLIVQGVNDLLKSAYGTSKLLSIGTLVLGIVLFFLPRTLTQTVVVICGLVLMVIGIVNLASKLRACKRMEGSRDPNIIDADE